MYGEKIVIIKVEGDDKIKLECNLDGSYWPPWQKLLKHGYVISSVHGIAENKAIVYIEKGGIHGTRLKDVV